MYNLYVKHAKFNDVFLYRYKVVVHNYFNINENIRYEYGLLKLFFLLGFRASLFYLRNGIALILKTRRFYKIHNGPFNFPTYLPNDRNGKARHWRYTCSPFLHFHDILPSHSMFFSSFLVICSISPSWWNVARGLFITSSAAYPKTIEPDLFMYCG